MVERRPLFPEAVSPLVDMQNKLDRIEAALASAVQRHEALAAFQAQTLATLTRRMQGLLMAVVLVGLLSVAGVGVLWWKMAHTAVVQLVDAPQGPGPRPPQQPGKK